MGQFKKFITEITQNQYFRGANVLQYSDGGGELYISFQAFLKFLEEEINIKSNGKPVIKIDWESDKPFFAFSTSVSFNLLKCYLYNPTVGNSDGAFAQNNVFTFHPFTAFAKVEGKPPFLTEAQAQQSEKITAINTAYKKDIPADNILRTYPQVGNINYIYLNAGFVAEQMTKQAEPSDTAVSVRKLLQVICDEVGKALGSINDFQVVIDDDENVVTIIDYNQKRIKGLSDIQGTHITTIKAQGLGSFVTGISAQSSITPDLATVVSVGAQANGNKPGVESVSLSLLNNGLTDRFYVEKAAPGEIDKTDLGLLTTNAKEKATKYLQTREAYVSFIENQKEASDKILFKSTDKLNLENICADFYKALLGAFTHTKQTSTSFIPVKLDLSLAGMSGIKIFQRFTLSGDVLPYMYKDNFDFIITGVSHEVAVNNRWTTKLSAIIALKEQPGEKLEAAFIELGSATEGIALQSERLQTSYPELPFTVPPPPSNLLTFKAAKQYLTQKYNEGLAKAVFAILVAEAAKNADRTAFVSAGGYNYAGVQTDVGRWGAPGIIGQYERVDSAKTIRSFAIFQSNETFLDFLANRVKAKNISGVNGDTWTAGYINNWWSPKDKANYTKGTSVYNSKLAIYNTAMNLYKNA